jgi:signal peptidase I
MGFSMTRWFLSKSVRQATELQRQVRRLLNEQRDLLRAEAISEIERALREMQSAIARRESRDVLQAKATELLATAEKSLIPYPNSSARENIKELFVAATLVLSITCFFVQLTKIPTGSMQPTLFGITSEDLRRKPDAQIPGQLGRIVDYWWKGISYYQVTARADGEVNRVEPPRRLFPFVRYQMIRVGTESYKIWFPPDDLATAAGLFPGQVFRKGEDIIRARVVTGDHLLVDRLTYNFRRPKRGEIIVFKTRNIKSLEQGQLYIKRMVAMEGEHVRIGDDQHLIIDGKRLDSATPRFEYVYTFPPNPKPNQYFGHLNQHVAVRWTFSQLAPLFPNEQAEYVVRDNEYMAMGDNTMNSRDSRDWGGLPQENVIGKCWFVYWPITHRFGWGYR